MPLEKAAGRNPGNTNDTAAPSAAVVPSTCPTTVPAGTLIVVPAGSVIGVPAFNAIEGPPLGRLPVIAASRVARVLSGIGVSGWNGWPDGGLGCGRYNVSESCSSG